MLFMGVCVFSTCFANRLVSHLNRCNARVPPVTPPYYRENINAGTVSSRQGVTDGWGPPLRSLSDSHLIELLSRIDMAYESNQVFNLILLFICMLLWFAAFIKTK